MQPNSDSGDVCTGSNSVDVVLRAPDLARDGLVDTSALNAIFCTSSLVSRSRSPLAWNQTCS
jgi:hypothetical protein